MTFKEWTEENDRLVAEFMADKAASYSDFRAKTRELRLRYAREYREYKFANGVDSVD